ncbi:hypothetical protein [Priestia flexa]|uniref:hypothetical protein n=1 Tax=Priestia flexa TaxID=86664 RepID=UPI00077CB070|nr:hypothetical protein [Priestia flexa]MED4588615.1 hypothetical protein [Priestia flexa]
MKYFYQSFLDNRDKTKGKIGDLKHFIRNESLDKQIEEAFPRSSFGKDSDDIEVKGSKQLLEAFINVDNAKMDLPDPLEDIKFIKFDEDDKHIVLEFTKTENLQAKGVYNFTHDFLDDLFTIGGFYSFCVKKGSLEILSNTLENLFEKFPDLKRQYRFLKYNDEWVLRGVTSTKYKNYDNHIVIYLSLLALHNYSQETKKKFSISEGRLSDSDISIYFEEEDPIHLEGVGDVYFRIYISNGEIRQKFFTFEVGYRIDNGKSSFVAMPELNDPLVKVSHSMKVESVKERIENIFNLDQHKNSMLEYIVALKNEKKLSPDAIHYLFSKIIRSQQKFSENTKNKAKNFKESSSIVDNTLTLIEVLDRLSEITTDINEAVHLQRIYDDVIRNIAKNS